MFLLSWLLEAVWDLLLATSMIVLGIVIVALLTLLVWRGWFNGDQDRRTENVNVPQVKQVRKVNIIPLRERNFADWLMSVECALEEAGLSAAIKTRLHEDDLVNKQAFLDLYLSVPDRFKTWISNTRVCFEAIEILRARLGVADSATHEVIKEEIKSIKLVAFDEDSVEKHLTKIQDKIYELVRAGANVPEHSQCEMIVDSLPKDSEAWEAFNAGLAGTDSLMKLTHRIRKRCRGIQEKNNTESVYMASQHRNNSGGHSVRSGQRKLSLCYNCWQWGEHFSKKCPNPTIPKPSRCRCTTPNGLMVASYAANKWRTAD